AQIDVQAFPVALIIRGGETGKAGGRAAVDVAAFADGIQGGGTGRSGEGAQQECGGAKADDMRHDASLSITGVRDDRRATAIGWAMPVVSTLYRVAGGRRKNYNEEDRR